MIHIGKVHNGKGFPIALHNIKQINNQQQLGPATTCLLAPTFSQKLLPPNYRHSHKLTGILTDNEGEGLFFHPMFLLIGWIFGPHNFLQMYRPILSLLPPLWAAPQKLSDCAFLPESLMWMCCSLADRGSWHVLILWSPLCAICQLKDTEAKMVMYHACLLIWRQEEQLD